MATQFAYVAVLGLVLAGCLWLEVALRTRVLARPRRVLLTIAPVVLVFFAWDSYAISRGHWSFDADRILGVFAPWSVPLDEIGFFVVIPLASILTFEAVRSVRGDPAGDEGGVGS